MTKKISEIFTLILEKVKNYNFNRMNKKDIKAEIKYLKEHPEERYELYEEQAHRDLKIACGNCPDMFSENCPRDPLICESY